MGLFKGTLAKQESRVLDAFPNLTPSKPIEFIADLKERFRKKDGLLVMR